MYFIEKAVDMALWDCIKECAEENNIDYINVRHYGYADDDHYIVDGKLFIPKLVDFFIPNIPTYELKQQINEVIKNKNANAIILGEVEYWPSTSSFIAKIWFGEVDKKII